jgi:hypothetical protein
MTPVERALADQLEAHQLPPLHIARRGVDFVVDSMDQGQPLRLHCLTPFSTGRDVDQAASDPCFFRLELGEFNQPPHRWAAWSTVAPATPEPGGSPPLNFALQALWAPQRLALAVSCGQPDFNSHGGTSGVRVLFDAYRRCRHWPTRHLRDAVEPGLEPDRPFENEHAVPPPPFRWPSLAGAAWATMALSAGALTGSHDVLGPALLLGLTALAGGGHLLSRSPRKAMGTDGSPAQAFLKSLHSLRLFDAVKPVQPGPMWVLPAVADGDTGREPAFALVCSDSIRAESSRHGLALDVVLSRVEWPSRCLPVCRLLPSQWVAAQFQGTESTLLRLPSWPRQTRKPGLLRWLMTDDEVRQGELANRLEALARRCLGGRAGPYRA